MSSYVPTREQYREYAGRGNLIPVYREVLADGDTPVTAYAKVGRRPYAFLLESVDRGAQWAAHSFIGVEPRLIFRARGDQVVILQRDVEGGAPDRESTFVTDDPLGVLAGLLGELRPEPSPGLPHFFGGAVGYLGFDLARRRRGAAPHLHDLGLPDCAMVVTDTLLVFDNLTHAVKIVANSLCPARERADACYDAACARIEAISERLAGPLPAWHRLELDRVGPIAARAALPPDDFVSAVRRGRDLVSAGEVHQVVLAQRFELERGDVEPFDLYRALRAVEPSSYLFHLELPECTVTGVSPECVVRLDGDELELRPFAGSRPRGRDDAEDDRLADELLADERARADHVLVVDLARSDLGRVATSGSVAVPDFMAIEGDAHAMVAVSTVTAHLAPGRDALDVLRATSPSGSLVGAPKARALEIIDELEPVGRGVYGGAVGTLSFTGNLDLALSVRTLVTQGDRISVHAGARVRHDTDPERAYEATVADAAAVARAVALARGV